MGDFPEAIQAYEEALSLDPSSPLLRQSLQRAKMAWKSQRDRQVRALSRAFRVNGKEGNRAPGIRGGLKGIVSIHPLITFTLLIRGYLDLIASMNMRPYSGM